MRLLLIIMAVAESAAGMGLIGAPSTGIHLLFGVPLDVPAGPAMARVTGIAMLALGVGCWTARADVQSLAAKGLLSAMLVYNGGVAAVLVFAAIGAGLSTVPLWTVAISHAGIAGWCLLLIAQESRAPARTGT